MSHKKTLGIVGGGQLGRMLTQAAMKLGFDVIVLDPNENCPAKQVGAEQIVGSWKDKTLLKKLVAQSDFTTIEIEHIDTEVLANLEKNKPINPAAGTVKLIQNKYEQKKFLTKNNLPVAEFEALKNWDDVTKKIIKWKGSVYVKSKFEAYDGRGNWLVSSEAKINDLAEFNDPNNFYVEKLVGFKKELAVMVAKDMQGNVKSYPVTQTFHERSICIETHTPSGVPTYIETKAKHLAEQAVSHLDGAGVYGVEMFLTELDTLYINEIAPRVHNSGHYTMDACVTSQFEQHVRAVTGLELGSTDMKVPATVMINILGERNGPVELKGVEEAEKIEGVSVYIYGKSPTKIDRKMGHINATGATIEEARDKASKARGLISI